MGQSTAVVDRQDCAASRPSSARPATGATQRSRPAHDAALWFQGLQRRRPLIAQIEFDCRKPAISEASRHNWSSRNERKPCQGGYPRRGALVTAANQAIFAFVPAALGLFRAAVLTVRIRFPPAESPLQTHATPIMCQSAPDCRKQYRLPNPCPYGGACSGVGRCWSLTLTQKPISWRAARWRADGSEGNEGL